MSRPKLNMPLKEQNSPRSQWISNVSLLKNQLKDGELVDSNKGRKDSKATNITWTELEAQLGKRMREKAATIPNTSTEVTTTDRSKLPSINTNQQTVKPGNGGNNPLSPTSGSLNLIPHPRHSPTRSNAINAPLPPGIPSSPSKRPTLNIPFSPQAKDILKQVHNGTAHLPSIRSPNTGTTSTTATTSRSKPTTTKDPNTADLRTNTRTKNTPMDANGRNNSTQHEAAAAMKDSSLRGKANPPTPLETPTPVVANKEETQESKHHRNDTETTRFVKSPMKQQAPRTSTITTNAEVEGSMTREIANSIKPYGGAETVALEDQNRTETTEKKPKHHKNKIPRPETTTSKTKGSMSWLRSALKPNSRPTKRSIAMSTTAEVSILTSDSNLTKSSSRHDGNSTSSKSNGKSVKAVKKYFRPTTPLQLGLWLSELQKAIRQAKLEHEHQAVQQHNKSMENNNKNTAPMRMVDALPQSPQQRVTGVKQIEHQNQQQVHGNGTINTVGEGEDVYYHKNRDIGVYVDYSTFDDGDSVSSIELLFKWLTCRDLNDTGTVDHNHRGDGTVMTPPGTVIATESNVSDDLSIDLDARPTRRTFFSR